MRAQQRAYLAMSSSVRTDPHEVNIAFNCSAERRTERRRPVLRTGEPRRGAASLADVDEAILANPAYRVGRA
jgi:hypothetical protein